MTVKSGIARFIPSELSNREAIIDLYVYIACLNGNEDNQELPAFLKTLQEYPSMQMQNLNEQLEIGIHRGFTVEFQIEMMKKQISKDLQLQKQ